MGKDFAFKEVFKTKIKPASVEEMLSKIPVFDKLTPKELRSVASIVHHRQYVKGEFVFYQGDPGLGMYVIEKGAVGVVVVGEDGAQKEITELRNGDFFGEIALLDESARSASVVVKEDSELIGFFRPDLFEIIEKTPKTGLKIVVKLAEMIGERLRNMNTEFSRLRAELESVKQQKETSDEKANSKKKRISVPKKIKQISLRSVPLIGLKKILVPIDFSDNSKKALRYAIPFAQQFNASLILVYIIEPTIYPSDFGFGQIGFPDVEKELQEKALSEMAALKETLVPPGVKTATLVGTGIPFVEITQFAKEHDVDIIIVATHGMTGVEHILFGSTAEKIIRKAPCPVLVVRSEEHDFIDERV